MSMLLKCRSLHDRQKSVPARLCGPPHLARLC